MLLNPSIWPECPAEFDANGLALVLLALPSGTRRAEASALARSALRTITGRLLSIAAAQVPLSEGQQGPTLTGIASGIHISLSYAGDRVLIGLSKGRALGVDIVAIESIPEFEMLSRLYLPKAARLAVLESPLRDASFALAWAQTEASCKALSLPLAEIDEEREYAYAGCELLECGKTNGYRMAVALQRKN